MTEREWPPQDDRRITTGKAAAWWRLSVGSDYISVSQDDGGARIEVGFTGVSEEPAHAIDLQLDEARSLGRFLAGGSP